jgi:hypothetical protein
VRRIVMDRTSRIAARLVAGETSVDRDEAAMRTLRLKIEDMYDQVAGMMWEIDARMSSFMSPGARAAFLNGLYAGIRNGKFDLAQAKRTFARWFDR